MRLFNWAENFKEQPTCEDILKKVRKIEITCWIFIVIFVLMTLWGIGMVQNSPDTDLRQQHIGIIVAVAGLINIALMKIWAHIKLTTYFIIWDSVNRIDSEIRKSEAADL